MDSSRTPNTSDTKPSATFQMIVKTAKPNAACNHHCNVAGDILTGFSGQQPAATQHGAVITPGMPSLPQHDLSTGQQSTVAQHLPTSAVTGRGSSTASSVIIAGTQAAFVFSLAGTVHPDSTSTPERWDSVDSMTVNCGTGALQHEQSL
jgi:hypothetical protein